MIVSILIFQVLLPLFFVLRLWKESHGSRLRWGVSLFAAGSYLAFAFLIGAWYWTGYPFRFVWPLLLLGAAVASFPLRDGVYWGTRARGLYPADPARYSIFGDTIFSPCTGAVADSRDGLPDLSPPARDEENVAGNYVALECGGAAVLLAHFRSGSIRVGTGDKVATGQPLGQVGNSGNTSEPHLHIHVERTPYGGEGSTRPGLPMRFDGRFLVRNSVVFSRP